MKLERPSLLIQEEIARRNIERFNQKAIKANKIFRPHFKTHQSIEVGRWFKAIGVNKIAVSSLYMAAYFAQDDWNDITVAVPVNLNELELIRRLSAKIKLNLLVDSPETVRYLSKNLDQKCGVYIEIDTGYHRTGINIETPEKIDECVLSLGQSENLIFEGFLSHAGQTYGAKSKEDILQFSQYNLDSLKQLKERYLSIFPHIITSFGDTPSISLREDLAACDEIRPGNFVLYDYMQYQLGSCQFEDIASIVACPIISIQKERNEVVIYGGAIHLSKEHILNKEQEISYGLVCNLNKGSWSSPIAGVNLSRLSQEHGVIKGTSSFIDNCNLGNFIGIVPVHSCLTVDLMGAYKNMKGENISTIQGFQL